MNPISGYDFNLPVSFTLSQYIFSHWSFREGSFVCYSFDQGRSCSTVISEKDLRSQIARLPEPFRRLLGAGVKR